MLEYDIKDTSKYLNKDTTLMDEKFKKMFERKEKYTY